MNQQPATSNPQAAKPAVFETILVELSPPYLVRLLVDNSGDVPRIVAFGVEAEPQPEPQAAAEPQPATEAATSPQANEAAADPQPATEAATSPQANEAAADPEPATDAATSPQATEAAADPEPQATDAATVDAVALSRAVARLVKMIGKPRRPILRSVRVTFGGDFLTLSATDLDAEAVEVIDATGSARPAGSEAVALVDAAALAAAVKSQAKRGSVEVSATAEAVRIGAVIVPAFEEHAAAEYPADGFAAFSHTVAAFNATAGTIAEAFGATVPACDKESSRYALAGVRVEVRRGLSADEPAAAVLVATDGRRLHKFTIGDGVEADEPAAAAIVPLKAARLIAEAAKKATFATVELLAKPQPATEAATDPEPATDAAADSEPQAVPQPEPEAVSVIFFDSRGAEFFSLTSRLVEGRYPRWRDAFKSTASPVAVDIDAAGLLELIKQAKPLLDDTRGVQFELDGRRVTVAVGDRFRTSADIVAGDEAEPFAICLDCHYLTDALTAAIAEPSPVRLLYSEHNNPAIIEAGRFAALVMPLTRRNKPQPEPATEAAADPESAATPEPQAEAAAV